MLVAVLVCTIALIAIIASMRRGDKEAFQSPSVLLIEDTLSTTVVFDGGTYDHDTITRLIPISQGKVSISKQHETIEPSDVAIVHCINISKYEPRGHYLMACTDDVYMPMFVTTAMFDDERELVFLTGKRVGFVDKSDLAVLRKLLFCYKMDIGDIDLVEVDISQITQEDISLSTDFDCIFVLMNPSDVSMYGLRSQKINMYSYRGMDVQRSKKVFPCAQIVQRDIKPLFPRLVARRRVETFLEFRNVVYSKTRDFKNYTVDLVIRYFERNMGILNFFERYYALHPRTAAFQREFNKEFLIDRSDFSVLEQFDVGETDDPRMRIQPKANVPGFLVPSENTFFCEDTSIDGIPLIVGDVVSMSKQSKADENGEYEVLHVGDENAATRLVRRNPKYPVSIDTLDNTHTCVTNPSIKYKHECLNPFDQFGNPKASVDVWDGPCKTNLQCPFYQHDPYTKTYKGGCVNGYCQMPMGYTRIGYTKYVNQ
jgi:hypothetical protein